MSLEEYSLRQILEIPIPLAYGQYHQMSWHRETGVRHTLCDSWMLLPSAFELIYDSLVVSCVLEGDWETLEGVGIFYWLRISV